MKPGMKVFLLNFNEEYGCADIYDYQFEPCVVVSSDWYVCDEDAEVEELVNVKYVDGATTDVTRKFLLTSREKKDFQLMFPKRKKERKTHLWKFTPESLSAFHKMDIDFVVAKNGNDAAEIMQGKFSGAFRWIDIEPYDGPKKNKSLVMKARIEGY